MSALSSTRLRIMVLLAPLAAGVGVALLLPRTFDPAATSYADQRAFLGIPNAADVLTNALYSLRHVFGAAACAWVLVILSRRQRTMEVTPDGGRTSRP